MDNHQTLLKSCVHLVVPILKHDLLSHNTKRLAKRLSSSPTWDERMLEGNKHIHTLKLIVNSLVKEH
jgi:hypothetical protein